MSANGADNRHAQVSEYYGSTLKSSSDLRTSACCPIDAVPTEHRAILERVHPEVRDRFYGCGSPLPDALKGAVVLDLGCGTGRDVYLASALVGPNGRVIGIDMTDAQLDVARKHQEFHARELLGDGARSNVEFRKGLIEDLAGAGIESESVDVVISNCVCNLAPDKRKVFSEVFRVLSEGGELYFSDIYADRRLTPEAQADPVLVGECLGGALYIQDFRRIMAQVGFNDIRLVSCAPVVLNDESLLRLVPGVNFYSITCRAFKISSLEDRREDYGQTATYTSCCGDGLKLDAQYAFSKKEPRPVDANTAAILTTSRYSSKFTVTERGRHRGLIEPAMEGGAIAALLNQKTSALSSPGCCTPSGNPATKSLPSCCSKPSESDVKESCC